MNKKLKKQLKKQLKELEESKEESSDSESESDSERSPSPKRRRTQRKTRDHSHSRKKRVKTFGNADYKLIEGNGKEATDIYECQACGRKLQERSIGSHSTCKSHVMAVKNQRRR